MLGFLVSSISLIPAFVLPLQAQTALSDLSPTPTITASPTPSPTPTPTPLPTLAPLQESSPSYNQAKSDYEYQTNQYRQAFDEYQLAKNRYLQFQTLTTKQEALEKTKQLIKVRDLAVKAYLSLLNERLSLTPGITPTQLARYQARLGSEIDFLDSHLKQVDSFASLKDAFASSDTFQERYSQQTENLSYETLHLILTGNELAFRSEIQDQITFTRELLSRLKVEKDTTKEERWTIEAQNRLVRHQEKLAQTNNKLQDFLKIPSNRPEGFSAISILFQEANQYLKEAVSNLKETLKEVKRG